MCSGGLSISFKQYIPPLCAFQRKAQFGVQDINRNEWRLWQ